MSDADAEVLYGRSPDSLRVFVSSQMRGDVLKAERRATADTINKSPMHHAWCWEDNAPAGAYHSKEECIGYARTSDGLVLLLGSELTPVTRDEYEVARTNGAQRFIFIRETDVLTDSTKQFVEDEQARRTVTRKFGNLSELRTSVTDSLIQSAVRASRSEQLRRREVEIGSSPPPVGAVTSVPPSEGEAL